MNERFETLKSEILRRAHENGACREQYGRAYNSDSFGELMEVLRDNFNWACLNNVLNSEIIQEYESEFAEASIYANKDTNNGYLLAWDNATVRVWDNATVRASGNATVRAWGNATVRASGNAYVTSYTKIEYKLSEYAIYRIRKDNIIYANGEIIIIKQ